MTVTIAAITSPVIFSNVLIVAGARVTISSASEPVTSKVGEGVALIPPAAVRLARQSRHPAKSSVFLDKEIGRRHLTSDFSQMVRRG
jgi:hypothetical protein